MKVYISADIEGVTGTTAWDETYPSKPEYAEFRDQMTAEVAAACKGAIAAGATEIWVQDAHDGGRNVTARKLPEEAKLVRGWSGNPLSMVQEIDASFNAVLFVGYHSCAGSGENPLSHTWNTDIARMTVNGLAASEFMLHAYAAASLGVPPVFISGDEGICRDASRIAPGIEVVAVKRGAGASTVNLHPEVAVRKIRDGVEKALRAGHASRRLKLPPNFVLEASFKTQAKAKRASYYPGAVLVDESTVRFEAGDYIDVMKMIVFTM